MAISLNSYFTTNERITIEQKISEIVSDAEQRNPGYKAFVKILKSTPEEYAPGNVTHLYNVELIHKDDLKEND